ncbi:hypothetical protein CNMCM8980_000776 [Aspergillus fumigatiaffinis]|jgi:hypothetical protein|uniref:Uncharacterized protein n=1 Tax=Aspergillus fumigatiaffinis TaxID=340414 RepID=A0A8H4H0W0_9EURO|nr:hypothetical protein CNMCM5878_001034 [Aspergillus fumigatiaffinis]KAF4222992.1 hypothetical protein CNMCM6457_000913 [Aspergillus fumigatiaffinis]KAF4232842.1 hypothetical protein CNMCM6805_009650 [Aspergillus fumigatiaffinis]KAF4241671.1 hypothetical protein CNMCM8980_000776 [Aspergillus fumigatiaffinis]
MFADIHLPNQNWIIEEDDQGDEGCMIRNTRDGSYVCYDGHPLPGSVCKPGGRRTSRFKLERAGFDEFAVKVPHTNLVWTAEGEQNELHLEEENGSWEQKFKFDWM